MKAKSQVAKSSQPDFFDELAASHRDIVIYLDKLLALLAQLQATPPTEKARREAREVVAFFAGPAREHNYDEERHVFPTLLACEDLEVRRAAQTLSEDHAWIELCWLDIEPQLAAVAAGTSSSDLPVLRSAAEAFVTGTRDHMALEESLLFPQLRSRLKPGELRWISREIATRRALGRRILLT